MIVQMDYVTLKTNTPSPPALFCEYMYGFTQNTGKQKEKKKNPKQKKKKHFLYTPRCCQTRHYI